MDNNIFNNHELVWDDISYWGGAPASERKYVIESDYSVETPSSSKFMPPVGSTTSTNYKFQADFMSTPYWFRVVAVNGAGKSPPS